jgi:hypothetical protein
MVNLRHFEMIASNITGPIPNEWVESLVSLAYLELRSNPIGGTLPEAPVWPLTYAWLRNCSITGTVPAAWSKLGMINIDLSFNNLSGTLPPELSTWVRINSAFFNNNQLSGTLVRGYR